MNASSLMANAKLVSTVAPWCRPLDNLELAVLLATQPWLRAEGSTRAELEQTLRSLADDLPIGAVYFQRVRRAVAALVEDGAITQRGEGRGTRFVLAPQGFVALMLNVQVLTSDGDPTIDAGEFEFKRELVAMWHQMFTNVGQRLADIELPAMSSFFAAVDEVEISGHQVMSDDVAKNAFDVHALIGLQRQRVLERKTKAEVELAEARKLARLVEDGDFATVASEHLPEELREFADTPEYVHILSQAAASKVPILTQEAALLRYSRYLEYLDGLCRLYAKNLELVELSAIRATAHR